MTMLIIEGYHRENLEENLCDKIMKHCEMMTTKNEIIFLDDKNRFSTFFLESVQVEILFM